MTIEEDVLRDLVIVIDTREQDLYRFKGHNIVIKTLKVGDYSIKGFEHKVAIERKTHGDFLGSITHGRKRFMKELNVMAGYIVKAIVVEVGSEALFKGRYQYAQVAPESVMGSIVKITVDYGVPVILTHNRKFSEQLTLKMLGRALLKMRGLR